MASSALKWLALTDGSAKTLAVAGVAWTSPLRTAQFATQKPVCLAFVLFCFVCLFLLPPPSLLPLTLEDTGDAPPPTVPANRCEATDCGFRHLDYVKCPSNSYSYGYAGTSCVRQSDGSCRWELAECQFPVVGASYFRLLFTPFSSLLILFRTLRPYARMLPAYASSRRSRRLP